VNASTIATDRNPQSADNWLVRGYVYQSLVGLATDANDWAMKAYDEALKLNPNDPYAITQKGIVYFVNKDYQNAKSNFEKALELKPDYKNAQDGIKAIETASKPPEPTPPESSTDKK